MIKYSVLMSLYIKEKSEYLKQSIDSMLRQTLPPDEIVIVEDGPLTDELYAVVRQYQKRNPSVFKIVACKMNVGLGLALNLGLSYCRNNLVARMDTDDISLPERCAKQVALFEAHPELDIIGTNIDEFSESCDHIVSSRKVPSGQDEIYRYAKRRSAFNHPTVMYKKDRVLAFGGYSDLRRNQDVDLFGRMLYGGCKAANINESLLLFRTNRDLSKRRRTWVNTKSYIGTIKKFWKIGYSSFFDFLFVAAAQTLIFLCPTFLQNIIYVKILRK